VKVTAQDSESIHKQYIGICFTSFYCDITDDLHINEAVSVIPGLNDEAGSSSTRHTQIKYTSSLLDLCLINASWMLELSNMFDIASIHRAALTGTRQANVLNVCLMNAWWAMPLQSIHLNRLDECSMSALRVSLIVLTKYNRLHWHQWKVSVYLRHDATGEVSIYFNDVQL